MDHNNDNEQGNCSHQKQNLKGSVSSINENFNWWSKQWELKKKKGLLI